ncbi:MULTISPECIES: hypothetical protein [Oscillatoriales]|nr:MULTISPECIES: hypothetical protein [Oscillatoriales]
MMMFYAIALSQRQLVANSSLVRANATKKRSHKSIAFHPSDPIIFMGKLI